MTMLHLTSDHHNILCLSVVQLSSPVYCCLGSEGGLSDLGEILKNIFTETPSELRLDRADCLLTVLDNIMGDFDTIETRLLSRDRE